jgi:hypothetical protein
MPRPATRLPPVAPPSRAISPKGLLNVQSPPALGRAGPFDREKVARLMTETSAIQNLLADRLSADEPSAGVGTVEKQRKLARSDINTAPAMKGLDDKHNAVLNEILQRPSWPMAHFRVVAAKAGLMPWACLSTLNEWAFDTYADLLLEGDQIVTVNQNLKKKIHV